YHEIVGRGGGAPPPGRRSEDDVLLLYTGGTTGLPKGVMWRQGDLWANLMGNSEALGFAPFDDLASFRAALSHPGMTQLLCCPLMHGTAMLAALITVFTGGQVVLLEGRHFDAAEAWRAVDDAGVNWMVIVGEPFARPLLPEL